MKALALFRRDPLRRLLVATLEPLLALTLLLRELRVLWSASLSAVLLLTSTLLPRLATLIELS